MSKNDEILVSVVIGFKDWGLDRLLGAIKSIRGSLGDIPSEVIISDYGSVDPSGYKEALETAGAVYTYVPTDGVWSRSRALNAGLKLAKGEFLVTTDADMVFSPTSFRRLLELLKGNPRTAFILQCRDLPEGITHEDLFSESVDWEDVDSLSRLRPRWGMGGLIAFDRAAHNAIRGLDERMQIYGGEDIDLAKRLLRIGYKRTWINDPEVRMYHVWHESSRESADATEAGREAIQINRAIHLEDKSQVRNLREWQGRPDTASPLVTVAMSTHNRADYLKDSISSVLGQTFPDWELIIVNDGSTDNTEEVLSQFSDPRIRVYRQENRGLAAARNWITSLARGRYIAVHDDDDIMLPQRLEHCLAAISGGVQGAYGGWVDFDNDSADMKFYPGKKFSVEALLFNSGIYLHPTLLVEKRVMEAIPYNETMRSGSDYNLALRMAREGVKLEHCGHYVLLRRRHDGQITNSDTTLQKVAGVVTSFYGRSILSPGDLAELRKERPKKDWAPITAQEDAESKLAPFLPDHLVSRTAHLRLPIESGTSSGNSGERGQPDNVIEDSIAGNEVGVWSLQDIKLEESFKVFSSVSDEVAITWEVRRNRQEPQDTVDEFSPFAAQERQVNKLQSLALDHLKALDDGVYMFVLDKKPGSFKPTAPNITAGKEITRLRNVQEEPGEDFSLSVIHYLSFSGAIAAGAAIRARTTDNFIDYWIVKKGDQ